MQTKEYEAELEAEILEKDKKLEHCLEKIASLQIELKDFKMKYQQHENEIGRLHQEIASLRKALKNFEDQKRELESLNDQWENSNRILEFSKQDLEEKLYQAVEDAIMYKEELGEVSHLKEEELQRLRDEIKDLKQELAVSINEKDDSNKIKELQDMLEKAIHEMNELKKNEEKLEGSCAVSVLVKIRPVLESDINKNIALANSKNEIFVSGLRDKSRPSGSAKSFLFEKVFGVDDSIELVFDELTPLFQHFSSGGSSCVISYGQTGSGKTYTMNGLIDSFLKVAGKTSSNDGKISLHCIEVYNDKVRDLLSSSTYSKNWKSILSISKKYLEGSWIKNAKEMIEQAKQKRCTKSTDLNETSSRSHCIYTFVVEGKQNAIMQFVDLAGSERIAKSGVVGDTLKEALHINRSLSALQDVISALEAKNTHVPFRNSLLTRLLKPSLLSVSSKVAVILNCSPTEDSLNESVSTLSLGLRLKTVDLAWSIRKELKNEEVERTLSLLEKERNEKNALSRKLDKFERDNAGLLIALKEKDGKISQLSQKLKGLDRSQVDENEVIRKELQNLKLKQQDTDRKLKVLKSQAEKAKLAKNKAIVQLKSKNDQIKRVQSAEPNIAKRFESSKTFNKGVTPTRIPRPAFTLCNSYNFI